MVESPPETIPESFEYVHCYLCGADDTRLVWQKRERTVVQCNVCDLIYTNPRPRFDKVFAEVYDVGESYLSKTERATKPARIRTYRRFLKELEPFRQTNSILEIGSGFGYFLNEARMLGWQGVGVEVSPFSVEYARRTYGVEVLLGTLEQHLEALRRTPFDVVALWNVFEHLPDPLGSLRQFHALLRAGGALLIKVPDARALTMTPRTLGQRLFHRRYLRRYYPVLAHMHLIHLTPETFGKMAAVSGFAPPAIYDHFPPEQRPTRNLRWALRHRLYIALGFPYNFVAITRKP
ncbi:MAG: class I SAM-dependent methyltransferase [Abditibacteriales bacterium]|nr:class I SAM-dependent methyltransferase [Abditibacteriales bacterium]